MPHELRQEHLLRRLNAAKDLADAIKLDKVGDAEGAGIARASSDLHDALAVKQLEKFQQGGVVVRNTETGSYEVHHGRPQGAYDPDRLGLGNSTLDRPDSVPTSEQHAPLTE